MVQHKGVELRTSSKGRVKKGENTRKERQPKEKERQREKLPLEEGVKDKFSWLRSCNKFTQRKGLYGGKEESSRHP